LPDEEWKADAVWKGGYRFVGSDLSGRSVAYDSDNDDQKGISPMRGLLTSLGACSGMDVVSILKKRDQGLVSLRVLLSGKRREHGYPKPWDEIHVKYVLSGEVEKKYVEEAIDESMTKFCSVAATIGPRTKITHSYEIVG
jgi:putative redox protein